MTLIGHIHFFFIIFIFYYGTHRPYSFVLLFLFFTMALIGHTHLFPFFKFSFLFCVNEKIIKINKK